jgi:8-oxo-dGTP pyrophosphatase MutT (NUDIX family)
MIQNHFTATGVVFNNDGKVLMIKHKKLGVWLPPGGHIDENELPCKAVLREILEETGVTARVISAAMDTGFPVVDYDLPLPMEILLEDIEGNGLHNHIDMIYLCKSDDSTLNPQESEIDGIGWFHPSEVEALETFENVRTSVKKAVKLLPQLGT